MTSETALRITLVVAAISALFVVLGLLGGAVRVIFLVVIAAATVIAAPQRANRGGG